MFGVTSASRNGRKSCILRPVSARPGLRSGPILGAGSVLRLIRDGEAVTRAAIARRTGLARSTVAQRIDALLAHELVIEAGGEASTGGRPPAARGLHHPARPPPLAAPRAPPPP